MKRLIKKIMPKSILLLYHYVLAVMAHWRFCRPSEKLIVIGVTGTSGKSTTIELIAAVLEQAGFRVGVASTIKFKADKKEILNDKKMTMVGRFKLQKLLSEMVKADCQYAVIETTSEGIAQFRHIGIHYDVCLITNLYPEHIDSHGSFEEYKRAKLKLFKRLEEAKNKVLDKGRSVGRTIIVNLDDRHAPEFLAFDVDKKYGFTTKTKYDISGVEEVRADIHPKLLGQHNVYNALAAYTVGLSQNIEPLVAKKAVESIENIPGRIEFINEGQPFTIIVDYAFEPRAMKSLYEVVMELKEQQREKTHRIIHVLGTTGGGRDRARGTILGKMAGEFADVVIATNEDPYDDDPEVLMRRVSAGAKDSGKVLEKNFFERLDRRKAIRKALELASAWDTVLITGKGSEQAMVVSGGKKIPWDDRRVVREELKKIWG